VKEERHSPSLQPFWLSELHTLELSSDTLSDTSLSETLIGSSGSLSDELRLSEVHLRKLSLEVLGFLLGERFGMGESGWRRKI